jgi:DNA-binding IclR family transcriptional regulator
MSSCPEEAKLLELLAQHPQGASRGEIEAQLPKSFEVARFLVKLQASGLVKRFPGLVFSLTERGRSLVPQGVLFP